MNEAFNVVMSNNLTVALCNWLRCKIVASDSPMILQLHIDVDGSLRAGSREASGPFGGGASWRTRSSIIAAISNQGGISDNVRVCVSLLSLSWQERGECLEGKEVALDASKRDRGGNGIHGSSRPQFALFPKTMVDEDSQLV